MSSTVNPPYESLEPSAQRILSRYPVSKRSALMPMLYLVQDTYGYISDESMEWVAKRLELEPIMVLEVVTFYPMFRRTPVGKYHFKVCRTLSCSLNGADNLREYLLKKLGLKLEEISSDGRFSVSEVECLACCGTAPVMMINDELYQNLTAERIDELVSRCQ